MQKLISFDRETKQKKKVTHHKKFTNPTSPMRSSKRLNKHSSQDNDDDDVSGEGTLTESRNQERSQPKPENVNQAKPVILDPATTCPAEQSVRYYHRKCMYWALC